jgi:tetratricopeptide (TPR) repeat protein
VIRLSERLHLPSQNIGAQFGLAKLQCSAGLLNEAENTARRGVEAAAAANLHQLSATGLTDLNVTLVGLQKYDEADVQLAKAIQIAKERSATRVEMIAKLYRSPLLLRKAKIDDGIALADEAVKYFTKTEDVRLLAASKNQLVRGLEQGERYAEARVLIEEELKSAQASKDNVALLNALEGMAGFLKSIGNLPEALKYRQQLIALNQNVPGALGQHLLNTAELLVRLGRPAEAEELLRPVDQGIAAKAQVYLLRRPRLAAIRELRAVIEGRWAEAIRFAAVVEQSTTMQPGQNRPGNLIFSQVWAEYAKAQLGTSRTGTDVLVGWPSLLSNAADRRECMYWVALTLVRRGDVGRARSLALEALADPGIRDNAEQGWRLAAVARLAAQKLPSMDVNAALSNRKNISPTDVEAAWGDAAKAYFDRPDLTALRKGVR